MRGTLAALLLVLGCAHSASTPPPLTGWRESRSAHFRLRTDLPPDSAQRTLEKLESLRSWLQAAWSTGGDSPGTTSAIVLATPSELHTFTGIPGVATTTREGSLLVTAGTEGLFGDRSPTQQVLAHEVAHELIRHRMPGAPRWFHEGLAGYLQTVVRIDERRVRFGWVDHADLQQSGGRLSLDEVETRRWETATDAEVDELYGSARLWVYLLRAEEPARMRALETALASGTPWRVAWGELRKGLDLVRLREKLWRLSQAGGWPTEVRVVAPLPPSALPGSEGRALVPWEVHLCLAELWSMAGRTQGEAARAARARSEIEAAAAAAPDEPRPQVWLAELEVDPEVRRARAEALLQRFPGSPEALVFRARVLRDDGGPPEGRRAAAIDAVTAAPDDVDALTAHAYEEARSGEYPRAFQALRRAEELEPWNPTVFVVRAVILGSIGQCSDAAEAMQRALDILPDDPLPADVQALVSERARIQASCRSTHLP